ncbi:hypothetical protein KP509_37G037000 [Ceratopteris richardii]|nr:hypothetical protein KP509_37G037000 [Ceratopteris richardii]
MDEFEASNFPSSLAGVVQDAVNSISHKEIITCTSFDDYSEGLTSFGDPLMVDGWSHNHLAVVSAQRISDNQEFMTKDLESTSLPSTQLVIGSGGDQSSAGCSSQNQDDRNHNYLSIASAGRTSDHRKAKSKDLDSSYLPTTLVLISGGVDQSSTGCSSANDSMEKISAVESIDSSSSSSHGVLHGEETYVARNRSYMENHLNGRISTGLHRSVGECRVRHPAGVAERKTSSACEAIVTEKKRLAKRDKAGKKACAAERYRSKVEVRKPHLNAKEVGDTSLASSSFTKTGTADVPLEEMSLDEVNNVFSLFQARQWAKIRQSP